MEINGILRKIQIEAQVLLLNRNLTNEHKETEAQRYARKNIQEISSGSEIKITKSRKSCARFCLKLNLGVVMNLFIIIVLRMILQVVTTY